MKKIRVHLLTDGRDCEDGTSIKLMDTLQKDLQALEKKGIDAKVASGGGRMCTTMDRYEVLPDSCICVRRIVAHELKWSAEYRALRPVMCCMSLRQADLQHLAY